MRELLQLPYPGPDIAILPRQRAAGRCHRRTAVGPVLAYDTRLPNGRCAVKPWHGEDEIDPLAPLVHEAMRRQAAVKTERHKRELG
jgi:hypothetical protein